MKGRVGCNILFCTPLQILGESPSQSVRGSKMFSVTYWSLAFLNSRRTIWKRSSFGWTFFPDGSFFQMDGMDLRTGLTYLRTQSNFWTSLRSSVYSVYYRTGRCGIKSEDLTPFLRHWSFRIKTVPQRPGLSVRRRGGSVRRWAFGPNARASRSRLATVPELHTLTI